MATIYQNIQKIRGDAVKGTDVREAIAAAIEQAVDLDVSGGSYQYVRFSLIDGTDNDYLMHFTGSTGS